MRAKFTQVLIALTLVCAIGGHWAILQSIAWVGMTVHFAQDSTLAEALSKTFGGQHPCTLCKAVKEGRQSEKKQPLLKLDTKLDLCLVRSVALIYPPAKAPVLPREADLHAARFERPPTPPPRAA